MKSPALFLSTLLGAVLLTGCATRYTITLTNGNAITAHSKPRLEGGCYVYQDANGQKASVNAGRVREIAPRSLASARLNSGFSAAPTK